MSRTLLAAPSDRRERSVEAAARRARASPTSSVRSSKPRPRTPACGRSCRRRPSPTPRRTRSAVTPTPRARQRDALRRAIAELEQEQDTLLDRMAETLACAIGILGGDPVSRAACASVARRGRSDHPARREGDPRGRGLRGRRRDRPRRPRDRPRPRARSPTSRSSTSRCRAWTASPPRARSPARSCARC